MTSNQADAKHRDAETPCETTLRGQSAQFELAERAARFGYWRQRLSDGHVTWSPGMYRLLNLDPGEKADNDWLLSQVRDEDVKIIHEKIRQAIISRSAFSYRTRAKDRNSAAPIVDTYGEVEVGPDGRVVSLIGVCHDVTKQVEAEEERAKTEQTYRAMTEQASDIIMLYDEDGRIVFASDALWRILRYKATDIERRKFLQFVHPDDRACAEKILVRPAPCETVTATYRFRHADGHYIWVEVTIRGVYDAEGRFQHTISVSRDVTERMERELEMKAARESAEAASKAKSDFLTNMSHELRTPLNAIIGFSDIMRQQLFGALGDPRYNEYATWIRQSGQLLLDLITDILDMAKIEAGKHELHIEDVNVAEIVEDCVNLLGAKAAQAGIQLVCDVPAGLPLLAADRRAVKQILLNLLSNAVKFSLRGGCVTVGVKFEQGTFALSVRDEGIGIRADRLPRLGRPFEQVGDDPLLAKGGSGLGLALVKALTQKHGGRMNIESALGVGTTVTIYLPLAVPGAMAAA